jgi:small GTP-binding protein
MRGEREIRGLRDVKVIIVGDPSVGKTSLLEQFSLNHFLDQAEPTVGAMFVTQEVEIEKGRLNLLIWDTAGQERYRSLIPMYSRASAAAVIVCDVSSVSSYESVGTWHTMVKESCPRNVKIYIIANKIDLPIVIPITLLEEWAAQNELPFFRASARQQETVVPIIMRIAQDIAHLTDVRRSALEPIGPEKDSCC